MSLTVLCDVDSTVLDFHGPFLALYNRTWGDDLTVERCVDWDMTKVVKPECGAKVYDLLDAPGLFLGAPSLAGAVEGLAALVEAGHDVYLMSDCFFPRNAAEKLEWCRARLPFVPRERVVMGAPKHLFRADVFVDDSPGQVRRYRQAWGRAPLVCSIATPYNGEAADYADVYAPGWYDTASAWQQVVKAIVEHDLDPRSTARAPKVSGSAAADAAGHFKR